MLASLSRALATLLASATLLVLPAVGGCQAEAKTAYALHPFVWEVEGSGAPCYLLGTMHVPHPRVTELHPEVEAILDAAGAVYTEIEMTPELSVKVAAAGMLSGGRKLDELLPADLYEAVQDYLDEKGHSMPIDHMQPWMVDLTLSTLELLPMMRDGSLALDQKIFAEAQGAGKRVGGVETVEEQIALFAQGTLEEQIHSLRQTLKQLQEYDAAGRKPLEELMELYLEGREEPLWEYSLEELDSEDEITMRFWRALLPERNVRMAERAVARMEEHPEESQVFAFGTLHFLGPESVIVELEKAGYQVTRLLAPPPLQQPEPAPAVGAAH